MSKEFSGEAGRIYIEKATDVDDDGKLYEVWFEDFCILGLGHTEREALEDAVNHTANISKLIGEAMATLGANGVASASGD